MPSGRQPRKKGQDNKPEILRSIRLGPNGDVYGPGDEDELLEALKDHAADEKKAAKAGGRDAEFDHESELERLTAQGAIVNFVDVDEDEYEHSDPDVRANARAAQLTEVNPVGEEGDGMVVKRGRRARARVKTTEGVQSGDIQRTGDGGEGEE